MVREGEENLTGHTASGEDKLKKQRGKTRRVRVKFEGKTASVRHIGNEGLSEPRGDQQLICLRSSECSQKAYEVRRTV